MTIETDEELLDLINKGWNLYYDKIHKRFRVYDPNTKKYEYVDASLNDLCMHLYKKQRHDLPPEESKDESHEERESDVKFIVSMIKQRLDPKAPIMTKWTENIAWWNHIVIDFSTLVLPEIFSMMSTEEIDISNPEVTVKHMVEKVKSLKEDALKARELEEKFDEKINEIEAKYKSDVEQLKLKVSELEELVVKYKGLSDELLKLVDDLRERTTKTLSFFMVVVPKKLPSEMRSIYASQLQQVKEIWGVEHE